MSSKTQAKLFISKWQVDNFGALFCWKWRLNENENWIVSFFKKKITLKYLKTARSSYLMHNIINKNFDWLALLYKIISQNSKIIPALFQMNHINRYFQITKIQLHHKLQVALVQYFYESLSFSRVCHKPIWLTNVLSVVVLGDNFHGFLIDSAKIIYIEISFFSLQQAAYFSSYLLNLFRNDHVHCYKYL